VPGTENGERRWKEGKVGEVEEMETNEDHAISTEG